MFDTGSAFLFTPPRGTGFQAHDHFIDMARNHAACSFIPGPGIPQRHLLGVSLPESRMMAISDDMASSESKRPDPGIRRSGQPTRTFGLMEGTAQQGLVASHQTSRLIAAGRSGSGMTKDGSRSATSSRPL